MSTATRPTAPETPSKKVAAELASIDVNATPSKKVTSGDFSEPAFLAKTKAAAEEGVEVKNVVSKVPHGKFVGEVDLPEEEEPLLVESTRRFVLFPIRYHEVSSSCI